MEIKCSLCRYEFKEGDTIYECQECKEIFCVDCIDEHIYEELEGFADECYEITNKVCEECGNCEETMYKCLDCDKILCKDCKEEHECDSEFEEIYNEVCKECECCEETLYECYFCENYLCSNCLNNHLIKNHKSGVKILKYGYKEYLKKKIIEGL